MPGKLQEEVIPGTRHHRAGASAARQSSKRKNLADLNLPSATGAVVVAIGRDQGELVNPRQSEMLRDGDVLGLAGTHHAIRAAIESLAPPHPTEAPSGAPT